MTALQTASTDATADLASASAASAAARSAVDDATDALSSARDAQVSAADDLGTAQQLVTTLTAQVATYRARVQADQDALNGQTGSTPTGSSTVRGWTETAWSGAGSGCSNAVGKPTWQTDTACSKRSSADVSAVGDPQSGLAVYDSFGQGGWLVAGGTSLATPLVAGMVVRSGHAADYSNASKLYAGSSGFNDVTSGTNGSCGGTPICVAGTGWDGPTGVGTPKSLASF